MFTKQNYTEIANIIFTIGSTYRGNYVLKSLTRMLADYFASKDSHFDRDKFYEMTGANY